ncbi:MAG: GDP-mannose 4,6-dehydratase [Smithella sp.]
MKKCEFLVIGSNSFSGATFIAYLLEKGHNIFGISRSPEANSCFLPYKWLDNTAHFKFVQADLNDDLDEIMDIVDMEKPDYIVNFASQSMVSESWKNPDNWFKTNTVSNVRLHNRLRKRSFLKKYVHVTTPEVYKSTNDFISEDTPFHPGTPYVVSHAASDMCLRTFFEAYNFPVVFTRSATIYGPGQQLYRIIPRTILFIMSGKKIQLHGGGGSRRSFIHMWDASEATYRIAVNGRPGENYHISATEIVSIRYLVERICRIMNVDFNDHVDVVEDQLSQDAVYMLDSSKLREALGWQDKITLDLGLDDCIAWVRANFQAFKSLSFDYNLKL